MASSSDPTKPKVLLSDEQVHSFIRDGFLVLNPTESELPASLHAELYKAAVDLANEARGRPNPHLTHFGDNLLARIPMISKVLSSPTVVGAVESVLGEKAVMHPHHFVHMATQNDQGRDARIGSTEVLPGTQYHNNPCEDGDDVHDDDRLDRRFTLTSQSDPDLAKRDKLLSEALSLLPYPVHRLKLVIPAGSIVIMHHDIIHRGTRQALNCTTMRFMYKWTYFRATEPVKPTWNHRGKEIDVSDLEETRPDLAKTSLRIWNWMKGDKRPQVVVDAAKMKELADGLCSREEAKRFEAGHELSWAGDAAVPYVLKALTHSSAAVRRMACFTLGETRTTKPEACKALVDRMLNDPDELVRSNAAFALGTLSRVSGISSSTIDALLSRVNPQIEPDNVFNASIPRSTTRQSIVAALLQASANNLLTDPQADLLASRGLQDPDRYVRGLTICALRARTVEMPGWMSKLVDHLAERTFVTAPKEQAAANSDSMWNVRKAKM